jgi:hypothetical protein
MIGGATRALRRTAIGAAWGALIAGACPARADQVTLEPSRDNTIFSESDSLSNGIGVGLFAGAIGGGAIRRALLAFDVAGAIPAGATITSAQLRLTVTRSIAGNEPMSLHRLSADWGEGMSNSTFMEGGQGAAAMTGDATWGFRFFNTQEWSTDGGDFAAAASAARQVGDSGPFTWGSTPEMVADVQGWLDAPNGNFGWLVRGNEGGSTTAKRFASGEASAATRPKLLIDFQPTGGGATATPSATAPPSATASATAPAAPTSTSTAPAAPTATPPADTPTAPATSTATASPGTTATAAPTETGAAETPTSSPTFSPTLSPTFSSTLTPTQPLSTCVGDCDGDGSVSISELVTGVNIALGTQPLSRCPAFDPGGGGVSISDLVTAVNNALDGCL